MRINKANRMGFNKIYLVVCLGIMTLSLPIKLMAQSSPGYSHFLPSSSSGSQSSGLSSGMESKNIPLASLSSGNINLPISLSYFSSGLKLDAIAGNVGLGWNLNAGGMITRTIRDDPDQFPVTLYPSDIEGLSDEAILYAEYAVASDQDFDTEPDLFSFNFPGGAGEFVFDRAGNVHTIPYRKLDVSTDDELTYFQITDQQGVIYLFDQLEITTTTSCETTVYDNVTTSWYLSTITHPINGVINLTYTDSDYTYESSKSRTEYDELSNDIPEDSEVTCPAFNQNQYCTNTRSSFLPLITEISSPNYGKVIFDYKDVDDYSMEVLNSISVYNSLDELLFEIELKHKYSVNDRLFLAAIDTKDKSGSKLSSYYFDYYDLNSLPRRLRGVKDHWGYYNGSTAEGVKEFNFDNYHDYLDEFYFPRAKYAKYGMLKSIVYPSALIESFEYESNQGPSGETGGLRLLRKSSYDPTNNSKSVNRYYYGPTSNLSVSSGVEAARPGYHIYFDELTIKREDTDIYADPCEFFECTYSTFSTNSYIDLYDYKNKNIIYEYVTISHGEAFENGGVEFRFDVSSHDDARLVLGENLDNVPESNSAWKRGKLINKKTFKKEGDTFVTLDESEYDYTKSSTYSSEVKGLVVRNKFENSCSELQTLVCNTTNTSLIEEYICPDFDESGDCGADSNGSKLIATYKTPCYGIEVGQTVVLSHSMDNIDMMEYTIHSDWVYLDQVLNTKYDEHGNNPTTALTTYEYKSSNHNFLTKVTNDLGGQGIFETSYYYPQDYPSSEIMDAFVDHNITNVVIETVNEVDDLIVNAQASKYELNSNGIPLVKNSLVLRDKSQVTVRSNNGIDFDAYHQANTITQRDNLYHMTEVVGYDDIPISYLYGYNQTMIVAKVINASNDQIRSVLPTLGDNMSVGTGTISTADLNALQNISGALVTSYEYDLGVGLKKQTDPNGKSTSYVYDDGGRLLYTKDQSGNILQSNEYHINTEAN